MRIDDICSNTTVRRLALEGCSQMFSVGMFQLMEWGWILMARERTGRCLKDTKEGETSGEDNVHQGDDS